MTSYEVTYYSLDEFASAAEKFGPEKGSETAKRFNGYTDFPAALELARQGWPEHLDATLEVAESAISLCDKEYEMTVFLPVHDVCGTDVDIDRYLAGEPECMIEYPPVPVSKVGKVITLCAAMSCRGDVKADEIVRRGQLVTALALALDQLGHSTELWLDHVSLSAGGNQNHTRVLIKGPNDIIDPERILFAYSHPAMPRQLGFSVLYGNSGHNLNSGMTQAMAPVENLPEGTIYLPEVRMGEYNDAHEFLTRYLRDLELIES